MCRIFWKRVISGKQLLEGYQIPRGWGISYIKWEADFYIIHPIPFNYIVAAVRWLLHEISVPWFVNKEKKRIFLRLEEHYSRGWDDGWEAKGRQVQNMEDMKWREHLSRIRRS